MFALLLLFFLVSVPAVSVSSTPLHTAIYAGNLSRVLTLLKSDVSYVNEINSAGETPIISLMQSWHYAINEKWPSWSSFSEINATFRAILGAGASPSLQCPSLDAMIFRNIGALAALLNAMNHSEIAHCFTSRDVHSSLLAHHMALSPSSGLSRLFFRSRALMAGSSGGKGKPDLDPMIGTPPGRALYKYLALRSAPLWESVRGGGGARKPSSRSRPGRRISGPAVVTKASLEEALGIPEAALFSGALIRALAAPLKDEEEVEVKPAGGMDAEGGLRSRYEKALLVESLGMRDGNGWTPLEVACAEGRTALVEWFLHEPGSTPPPPHPHPSTLLSNLSLWLPVVFGLEGGTPPRYDQYNCAHLAAARNDVHLLRSAFGRASSNKSALLLARDAWNRTACDIALSGGKVLGDAARELYALGVPCGSRASSSSSSSSGGGFLEATRLSCPSTPLSNSFASLTLPPQFSPSSHEEGGWALATPSTLSRLGLPADLFSLPTTNSSTALLVKGRRGSCPIDVLPGSVLLSREEGTRGLLLQHYLTLGRPFLLRTNNATTTYPSREDLMGAPWAGNLSLMAGAIPYAGSYGKKGGAVRLGEFLRFAMGKERSQHQEEKSDAGASRPMPPPYIFDAQVLALLASSGDGGGSLLPTLQRTFGGEAFVDNFYFRALSDLLSTFPSFQGASPRAPGPPSLSQIIIGPPGSGAAPHYHRSALNSLAWGLKLWFITPPASAGFVESESAAQWWEAQAAAAFPGYLFLQGPGDIVYVPPLWGHAVMNLADSFAVALEP